jgi:hypothetical protein
MSAMNAPSPGAARRMIHGLSATAVTLPHQHMLHRLDLIASFGDHTLTVTTTEAA